MLARFSDPQPLQIITDEAIDALQSLYEYKKGSEYHLLRAYSHMMAITAHAGRLLGSLKYIETNWDASLGALAQPACHHVETVRDRIQTGLEQLAEEDTETTFIRQHTDFLSSFIYDFGLRLLEDPQTFPSRYVYIGEQVSNGIIEVATECREEILRIFPDDEAVTSVPPPDALYVQNYVAYSGGEASLRPWRESDWGTVRFETPLASSDSNSEKFSKKLCRFCGCLVVLASTVGFVAGIVTVNPILAGICLGGLVTGAAIAVNPDAAEKLADTIMKNLFKLK